MQANLDTAQQRQSFLTGMNNSLATILKTIAPVAGAPSITPALIDLTQSSIDQLGFALREETRQLLQDFGINVQGQTGAQIVKTLKDLQPFIAGVLDNLRIVDPGRATVFENLLNAVIGNAQSLEENTNQLKELKGQLGQTQGFSTTSWQLFRKAIFDGLGGLLPQFQLPTAQTGGWVRKGGMVVVHPGEHIIPADIDNSSTQTHGDIHVNVTNPTQIIDPVYLGRRLAWEIKR